MAISQSSLLQAFPKLLVTGYKKTSEFTRRYNCLAWAAGETHRRWDPNDPSAYWPAKREQTFDAFKQAYATRDYVECADGDFEHGFEKIAIFAIGDKPQHAARQVGTGAWTSKLGPDIDIEHPNLEGLEAGVYGDVAFFMKRPIIFQAGIKR